MKNDQLNIVFYDCWKLNNIFKECFVFKSNKIRSRDYLLRDRDLFPENFVPA